MVDVMSFNVPTKGPNIISDAWKYRCKQVASVVQHYAPDIVCFQEPHETQTKDLSAALPGTCPAGFLQGMIKSLTMDTDYNFFGRGRDPDGADEYTPIFFLKERFEIADCGYFWLSETPDVPGSMGWDAACRRVCVWIRFLDKRLALFQIIHAS